MRIRDIMVVLGLSVLAPVSRADTIYGPGGSSWSGKFTKGEPQKQDHDDHHDHQSKGPSGPKPPSWKDNQARATNDLGRGLSAYKAGQNAWAKGANHLDEAIEAFTAAVRLGVPEAADALAKAENAKGVRLWQAGKWDQGAALVRSAHERAPGDKTITANLAEMNDKWCTRNRPINPTSNAFSDQYDFVSNAQRACYDRLQRARDAKWQCDWQCDDGADF